MPGPYKFMEQQLQVRFLQTHKQGLRQLFLKVSWDLLAWRDTADGVLVYRLVPKKCARRVQGPTREPCYWGAFFPIDFWLPYLG